MIMISVTDWVRSYESDGFTEVGDCLGTLLKIFKAPFLPYLMPMWGKDKTSEEKRIAICIFDDAAEHCRDVAVEFSSSRTMKKDFECNRLLHQCKCVLHQRN